MLIESDYLKYQIIKMKEVVERNDPGESELAHYAFNMVRSTLEAIMQSIDAIERHTAARIGKSPSEVEE